MKTNGLFDFLGFLEIENIPPGTGVLLFGTEILGRVPVIGILFALFKIMPKFKYSTNCVNHKHPRQDGKCKRDGTLC